MPSGPIFVGHQKGPFSVFGVACLFMSVLFLLLLFLYTVLTSTLKLMTTEWVYLSKVSFGILGVKWLNLFFYAFIGFIILIGKCVHLEIFFSHFLKVAKIFPYLRIQDFSVLIE